MLGASLGPLSLSGLPTLRPTLALSNDQAVFWSVAGSITVPAPHQLTVQFGHNEFYTAVLLVRYIQVSVIKDMTHHRSVTGTAIHVRKYAKTTSPVRIK